jgi:hypothetical protein
MKYPAKLFLVALVAAWVGLLVTAGDTPAQLYRYIDKNGNVVVTDNPPPGMKADVLEKGNAVVQPPEEAAGSKVKPSPGPSEKPSLPPKIADRAEPEVEKVAKEEADREVSRKMAEEAARKQEERQRRLEEANRLEQEARKPVQPTQENIDRQMKLMQEAERLRVTQ